MYLEEVERQDMDWIGMAQDRKKLRAVVNALMNSGFYKVWRIS
jgi:hypothetical protein